MHKIKENSIYNSINELVSKSNLIILGKILKIEKGENNIRYMLVAANEVYRGKSNFIVNIILGDTFRELSTEKILNNEAILYLTTTDKTVYNIVNKDNTFLLLNNGKINIGDITISVDKYITELEKIISLQPKSLAEQNQNKAIAIAGKKAIELGCNIKKMSVNIDEENFSWMRYASNNHLWENNKIKQNLEGKKYWAIRFDVKDINLLDGGLWVFIEKKTYAVLLTLTD